MTEIAPWKLSTAFRWREAIGHLSKRKGRFLRLAGIVILTFVLTPYFLTVAYLVFDPPLSSLMFRQALMGREIKREWRDLDQISPNLITQVITSEDGRFCQHWGVDWHAVDRAIDAVADGRPKGGGSTISMQTAKNLFLWNKPAYLRKALEIPLAYYMDFVLGKRRIMELYLNIVEWGPGVFGAEAAARHHFKRSAASLTKQEAAQLAAVLPNPKRRNAGRPGPATFALANRLRLRAVRERWAASCALDTGSRGFLPVVD